MMVSIIRDMVEHAVCFGKHLDVLFNLNTNIVITSFCPPPFLPSSPHKSWGCLHGDALLVKDPGHSPSSPLLLSSFVQR